jgi:hypothetical protein
MRTPDYGEWCAAIPGLMSRMIRDGAARSRALANTPTRFGFNEHDEGAAWLEPRAAKPRPRKLKQK